MTPGLTVGQALVQATRRLAAAGVEGASRDARWLLAWALGTPPERLTLALPEPMTSDTAARFDIAIARRVTHEPVSHITGRRLFWGREFAVDRDVLDPRPETEVLVELALAEPFERVLDLGTGTGCILVTLLAERPEAIGTGTDISAAARSHAWGNAVRHRVSDRVEILASDWFRPLDDRGIAGRFDLVVSNPPYIAAAEMAGLSRDVREHEPRLALTDEGDGLSAYRAIAAGVEKVLAPGGRVLVEIGPAQARAVAAMFRQAGLDDVAVHPDLDGRDRVVSGRG
ncbi:peptide chain release factor N(5)-glutamine methyltransferase [Palleronia sp. KMU-117]|uniref:peptide chain release factor N(5)-glutamine methyltransferase n=1 Tax=Palleronia sp. KMU-117 TaxID=3434108 RepID=UPI003D75E31F